MRLPLQDQLATRMGLRVLAIGKGSAIAPIPLKPRPQWRRLKCYAVVYVVAGGGVFHQADDVFDVPAGSAFFLFPDIPHHYGPADDAGWTELFFVFDGAIADRFRDQGLLTPQAPVVRPGVNPELIELWQHTVRCAKSSDATTDVELSAALFAVLAELFRCRRIAQPRTRKQELCEQIELAMKSALTESFFDLKGFAAEQRISYSYARRVFKETTGYTPVQFFTRAKIQLARDALAGTGENIGRIGRRLGFGDSHYFSRTFRKFTGLSPKEYRQSLSHWQSDAYWQNCGTAANKTDRR
ncbi:MAG: hypothetical protein A3K19_26325 [Lentisphaerae bacterium RIFOXYB12_FULL_65_16]|nr:MAG: hypothetical protein A3K18_08495 [Lentisphaerae bacterium RIFOXYA12_64_32]OGV87792.1 MAG: hypothetical protein A3K19_26325 [Lentisphaerae bacterium RIFOXYB12_FULL_65_16]